MCGFVGFVKNSDTKNLDKSIILNMNRSLSHRGPDNENYFETENLIKKGATKLHRKSFLSRLGID